MLLTSLALLVGLFGLFYLYMARNYNYFSSRGLVQVPPVFPWGSRAHWKVVTKELTFVTATMEIYEQYKNEKLVGHYEFDTPRLVVVDLELAKNIMIKDFDHFTDRRTLPGLDTDNTVNKVQGKFLVLLKGEEWKLIRSIYSPIFTSGKLKSMTAMINKSAKALSRSLSGLAESGEEFSAKKVVSDFTLDVIASCCFGIDSGAFGGDGENDFKRGVLPLLGLGRRGVGSIFSILTVMYFPRLSRLLNLSLLKPEPIVFLRDLVRKTIKQRRSEEGVNRRNDLIDLALDALKKDPKERAEEQLREDEQFEKDAQFKLGKAKHLSEEELESMLVSNAIQMFTAGYETTSTILAIALFHLAKHPDVQERAWKEVDEVFAELENEEDLDYRAIQKLSYLEAVLQETARTWPVTPVERECVQEYDVPGMGFTVPKGMLVQIPTVALMNDERHFGPNAEKFDPDNFADPERRASRPPHTFLPFGQGPRNCIGMRFAMLQMKAALAMMLRDFEVLPSPSTVQKLQLDPRSPTFQPKGGTWIKVTQRRK